MLSTAQAKQPESQDLSASLYKQLSGTEARAQTMALNQTLKQAQEVSSLVLIQAAAVALHKKRLEDAAFLYYIADFREAFDKKKYLPKGSTGNSPDTIYAQLSSTVSTAVEAQIIVEPVAFKRMLARVNRWRPQTPPSYSPGWDYKEDNAEAAHKAYKTLADDFHINRSGLATLLSDAEYLRNLKIVMAYNLESGVKQPSEAAAAAAAKRIEAIERAKNIHTSLVK